MKYKKHLFLICLFLLSSFCIPKNIALAEYDAQDIAVTKIGFEEQSVESGDVVFLTVTVEVENKGIDDAQNVPITVYVGEEIIAQDTIHYIPAGETFNHSYGWAISAKEIPFNSSIRAEIGSIERDRSTDNDRMSRSFTLTEEDGKVVIRYGISVHKWIVREAVYFLIKERVGDLAFRSEIANYVNELTEGAKDEDDTVSRLDCSNPPDVDLRYLRHFYRPTDNKGYYFKKSEWLGAIYYWFPCSIKERWGFQTNAFKWALTENFGNKSYNYTEALKKYKNNREAAYKALGHVLHLIADVSLPEHTHLEFHGEDGLGIFKQPGYESYVTDMIGDDEFVGLPPDILDILHNSNNDLNHIPEGYRGNDKDKFHSDITKYDIVRYNTLEEYIVNLAKLSYHLNRYKADFPDNPHDGEYGTSVGRLGEMFPRIGYDHDDVGWYIPEVGRLGSEWWETRSGEPKSNAHKKKEPKGFYYLEKTQVVPEKYKTYWNPDDKSGNSDVYEYLPQNYDNDPSNDISLARLYARDLIPLAIRYVAGAIELFWNETHPVLPFNASGRVTTNNGGGISGVTMSFTGNGTIPSSVQTNGNGYWNQSGFQSGTTYRVTPNKSGYTFSPPSRDFSSESTGLDFTGTPTPCTTLSTPNPTCVGTVNTTTPTLSWSDVANESGYEVKIFNGSCSGTLIHTSSQLPANSTSYPVPGGVLQSGQTYYWQVQAKGNGTTYCDSPWSDCCSFTIGTCTSTLSTPSPTCVSTVYTTTPNLRWYSVANASGYVVRIFSGSGCSGAPIYTTNPPLPANITTTGYDVPSSVGLQNGQTYSWQVQAKGNGTTYCDGPWSTCCSFTVSVCTTLLTPSPSEPSCGSTINTNYPVLRWSDVANESGYELRIFNGSGCSGTPFYTSTLPSNTTSYGTSSSTGLQSGQTYSWQVRAKGNGTTYCDSSWSSCCSFTINAPQPTPILQLSSSQSGPWSNALTSAQLSTYYLKCSGLTPNGSATIYWQGAATGEVTFTADSSGGNIRSSTPGCGSPAGQYNVRVRDHSSNKDSVQVSLTLTANPACVTEVIVDDQNSGFTRYGTPSFWHEAYIGYNSHMFWTYNNQNTIDNYAKWQPNLSSGGAGFYAVYAYIPNNYADTINATYTIFHNGITWTLTINQAVDSNKWVLLGSAYFSANGTEYVKLVDKTGETAVTKMIGFDAVKWVKQ
ncbi:MAG TPA: glycoside hydrolase family 78 protein [Candidatus Brocadiia bacterium]|nr:hypothetical protein [Candidatus Brocadiales bacterium]